MSDSSHEIWVIRHGETAWSRTGQHTGRTDVPLTDDGRRAASQLGQRLKERRFELVLTSPLVRASQTCELAGYGDVAVHCDDMVEWDYGSYEGLRSVDLRRQRPGWSIWKDGVPGGETIAQVEERTRRVLATAEAATGDVALFAHAHVLRVLTACWLGLPPRAARHFELGTAAFGVLAQNDGSPVLRKWNIS